MKLGFLGTGNMGSALIRGIIKSGFLTAQDICSFDSDEEKNEQVRTKYKINVMKSLFDVIDNSEYLVICVKPVHAEDLLREIKEYIDNKCIISVVAGKKLSFFEEICGSDKMIIRVMPNTPAIVNSGAFGISINQNIKKEQKDFVYELFNSCGLPIFIEDKYMDAVTGLSGSGPAYVFTFINALADGGVRAGLPRETALKLAAQTVYGAAKMVIETKNHPIRLRDMVSSPAGTTIEGIAILEKNAFNSAVSEAVFGAYNRSKELS